jgi:hypothetical protein
MGEKGTYVKSSSDSLRVHLYTLKLGAKVSLYGVLVESRFSDKQMHSALVVRHLKFDDAANFLQIELKKSQH